ncbi:hypothetical protein Tco_1301764 [Tanacetum coccineum]
MEISIADQIALDDALVAPADRLKIGKCNLRLSSDVTSKEATLQVVYDVLKLTPFYKAFQVTADVLEIYMQEFWVSAYMHNRSVRFKMNNKKHILNLDQFRDILQICPKVGNKKFEEPPLEKEILAFLANLGHSGEIRKITDVNVNKLHQPWRSFAAIINKCLSGKPSYDSLRLSQAQILWGMYNNKKVDYAYLLWEDFTYQIENKNTKKGNAMYYPRFTKLIVNFVMAKDPSIPRRNKVNWHYARDDPMFTTINVISRNEDTQLYGAILPAELTNEDIRNSEPYKEYHAIASGKIPPKTKASKKKADTDATTKQKPPIIPKEKKANKSGKGKPKAKELETISEEVLTEAEQLKIITKRSRKEAHSSHASGSSEDDHDDDEVQTESEDDGDDFIHPKLTTYDDEITHEEETDEDDTFDPIVHTPSHVSSSDDEDSDNEVEGIDAEGEKSDEDTTYVEDQGNEVDKDTNVNLEGKYDVITDVILPQVQATQEIEDTHVTLTPVNLDGQQKSSSVSSGFVSNMLNPNQDTGVDDNDATLKLFKSTNQERCWVGCKILGESLGELEDCISLVRDQVPIRDGTDSWQWMLEDGGFTVKVLKEIVGEKIPVRTLIDNIGMDFHSTLCPHCEEAIETIDHNVLNLAGFGSSKLRLNWEAVIWTSLYLIWKARNNKVFRDKEMSAVDLVFEIQLTSFFWVSHRCNSLEYTWVDWCNGPSSLI